MCAKLHQDSFKTNYLVCVTTDGHTDGQGYFDSSVDADSEYIYDIC